MLQGDCDRDREQVHPVLIYPVERTFLYELFDYSGPRRSGKQDERDVRRLLREQLHARRGTSSSIERQDTTTS